MDRPIRLLHVDDDPEFREVVADVLAESHGFEVVPVSGVEPALERLDGEQFDSVVSDYRLPGTDGLEFLDAVRAEWPDLPFVLFTGHGSEAVASEAISRGATDYIRKGGGAETFRLLANRVENAVAATRTRGNLEQYRRLVETVGDPMYVLDPDGTVTLANRAMAEMLGRDRDAVVGSHAREFLAEGDFDRGTEVILGLLEDPDRDWATYWATVRTTGGGEVPVEINVAPLQDEAGDYLATVGVVRDVSTRQHRLERLRALHETTRELMAATDVATAATVAVEAADEVLGLEIAAFYAPDADDALRPIAATDRTRATLGDLPAFDPGSGLIGETFERGEALFADDVRDHEAVYNPDTPVRSELLIPVGDHGIFVAASTTTGDFDRTDEELANVLASNLGAAIDGVRREQTLRERERELERYETIVRASPDEIYTLDPDGRFTQIVPPTESETTTSGCDPADLVGEHVSTVLSEADVERGRRHVRELVTSEDRQRASYEIDIRTVEGEAIPHETHIALLPADEEGRVQGTVGILRDISERVERERELQRQNDRLEAFARVASHDLRNPLGIAAGRLELAREDCDSEHLAGVADALDRMERLIEDTLTMARGGRTVTDRRRLDLATLVPDWWDPVATDGATLAVEDPVTVEADRDRLRQVFENLFRNAIEHGGADVAVRIGRLDDGFYVADDGPGIPVDERDDVLEPGYTTAESGTGFGLAIVKEIVEAHGWDVAIAESAAGGARFEITGVDGPG